MKSRFAELTAVAVAGVVLLSACAEASWVATVNDVPIEGETVLELRNSYEDEASSVAGEPFRQDLTGLIALEAQIQAAEEDFGLTGLDDPALRDEVLAEVGPADRGAVNQVAADPDLTEESLNTLGTQLAVRDAVIAELVSTRPDLLEDLWTNQPIAITQVCIRILSTVSEEEILEVAARLDAGEDFSAVADEVSPSPENPGGRLECPLPVGAFAAPFDQVAGTTPVGQVSEPFQSDFGWHLVLVDEIDRPESLEALQADPLRYVYVGTLLPLWGAWVDDALARADIWVRSQVGTWVPQAAQIVPPP